MEPTVFPRMCFDGKGHNIQIAEEGPTGSERVLYCNRCGDAVPLRVAIARTPSQNTGIIWPVDQQSSGSSAAS